LWSRVVDPLDRAKLMSSDPHEQEPTPLGPSRPIDPAGERARILAQVQGRGLSAHQAELLCATLALLAEMENPDDPEPTATT